MKSPKMFSDWVTVKFSRLLFSNCRPVRIYVRRQSHLSIIWPSQGRIFQLLVRNWKIPMCVFSENPILQGNQKSRKLTHQAYNKVENNCEWMTHLWQYKIKERERWYLFSEYFLFVESSLMYGYLNKSCTVMVV